MNRPACGTHTQSDQRPGDRSLAAHAGLPALRALAVNAGGGLGGTGAPPPLLPPPPPPPLPPPPPSPPPPSLLQSKVHMQCLNIGNPLQYPPLLPSETQMWAQFIFCRQIPLKIVLGVLHNMASAPSSTVKLINHSTTNQSQESQI